MARAALIIPVHNRRATTLACLRHLRTQGDLDELDCVIVDDGSTDGTAAAVQAEFPAVEILAGSGDLWWSGAIALGAGAVFGRGTRAAVWLNDDCLPEPGTLARLLTYVSAHPDALAAPTCIDARDGRTVATGFRGRQVVVARPGEALAVDGVSGFCLAVPRGAWDQLGPLEVEKFPHYAGDTAYTLRASQAGLKVTLLGDARVQLVDHHATPASPAALRKRELGLGENYRAIFQHKKSPFRLATQRHLLQLKYGLVTGTVLATLRAVAWQVRFLLGA